MTDESQDQRRYERQDITTAVVVTQNGACQIFNISPGGISFKCLYYQELPEGWVMDIIDSTGFHIQECEMEKVWEVTDFSPNGTPIFAMQIGAKFKNLTPEQQWSLSNLLAKLKNGSPS